MIDKRFGKKVNEKRKSLNLKTDELAVKCGIEPGYMRQILAGQVPSGQVIIQVTAKFSASHPTISLIL